MKTILFTLLLFALVLSPQERTSELIQTERINGISCKSFGATNSDEAQPKSRLQPWLPTKEQIVASEEALARYIEHAPKPFWKKSDRQLFWQKLATYKRQYYGIFYKGRAAIYGYFYCNKMTPLDCMRREVQDGGDCFLRIIYDVKDKKIVLYIPNGAP